MYTTRPLSVFKNHLEEESRPPPDDGRSSGHLVVKSAADDEGTCCFGLFPVTNMSVRELPFPQNCVLKVQFTVSTGTSTIAFQEAVVFVPVPGQPLSSNRYYAVVAEGKHKGLVRACSREEDMATRCFSRRVKDVEPRPFDPADVYQQMEIVQRQRGQFTARSVAADGFPSMLYRQKYWQVHASKSKTFDIGEALGLDAAAHRSRQLAGAAGKWYCPFFLFKEHGVAAREQMERSAFYEVALEQRWEPVRGDAVRLARDHPARKLASRKALIGGDVEAKPEAAADGDAYVWFAAVTGQRVGVCTTVWERMMWEESRGGWADSDGEVEAGDMAGGSVLVKRFVVKRLDGSVAVAFDFVHHDTMKAEQG